MPPTDVSTVPGLLLVRSNIMDHSRCPSELFTHWYNQVHIPEIIRMDGIRCAARYSSLVPEKATYPYLALYPIWDMEVLHSEQFKAASVRRDLLPGSEHAVFDVAKFEPQVYLLVRSFESECSVGQGPAPIINCVSLTESPEEWVKKVMKNFAFRKLRLYRPYPASHDEEGLANHTQPQQEFLGILELDEDVATLGESPMFPAPIERFRFLKGFGDVNTYF